MGIAGTFRYGAAAIAVGLTLVATHAAADANSGQLDGGGDDGWRFNLTPYLWMAGIDGDVTVRGLETDVDLSFSDILDIFDFGVMGQFEISKNEWSIMTDLVYLAVSQDADLPNPLVTDIDAELDTLILEVGAGYRVYESDAKLIKRPFSLTLLGGVRYIDIEADLDLTTALPIPDRSHSRDWLDPYVGFRTRIQWTKRWSSTFRADIGGFGVGSDFAYQLESLHSVALTDSLDLVLGFRRLAFDYDDGSGPREFEFDAVLSGPLMGVNIEF